MTNIEIENRKYKLRCELRRLHDDFMKLAAPLHEELILLNSLETREKNYPAGEKVTARDDCCDTLGAGKSSSDSKLEAKRD